MKAYYKRNIIMSILIILAISCIIVLKDLSLKQKAEESTEIAKIPKLYITGNIKNMQDKLDKRKVGVVYKSSDISFESYAEIKIQGAFSTKFDKKNYNITFYQDSKGKEKRDINIKWGNMSKYTLKADWMEQFHSRNIATAHIASEINKKYNLFTDTINYGYTDGFPIEIYINGKFLGLYILCIQKDYLLEMDESNPNNIAIMGGGLKLTSFDKLETEEWKNFDVEFGEPNEETLEKLNRIINFVRYSEDEDFVRDFEKYFNLDSVLNYYCFMQFAQLTDNILRNVYLVTYDGEIWYTLPFDLEFSWGNQYFGGLRLQETDNRYLSNLLRQSYLWKRVRTLFADKLKERYAELRQDILTKENVINKLYSFYSLIPQETLEKEYEKWKNKPGYKITYIEDYLDQRLETVDKELEYNQ